MSFLHDWFQDFLAWLNISRPIGRQINTTVIPFATKTTNLVDKTLSCKLLFVSVEGNIKNSDKTTVKYRPHDSNTWLQKQIFGCSRASFNCVIDELKIIPVYGNTRYGRCIVTYEGNYWTGGYIGTANLPNLVIDWIETINLINTITEITEVTNISSVDLIDLITEITTIGTIEKIESIEDIQWSPTGQMGFINPSFEGITNEGTFLGWITRGFELDDSKARSGLWSALCTTALLSRIGQHFHIPIDSNLVNKLSVALFAATDEHCNASVWYSDGTSTGSMLTKTTDTWEIFDIPFIRGKYIVSVFLYDFSDVSFWVDTFTLSVTQEIRLKHLKTENLRDALGLGVDVGQMIVEVASGKKVIVYGYNIVNNDADNVGNYNLYLGAVTTPLYSGTVSYFYAAMKTFVHPIDGASGEDVIINIAGSTDTDVIVFAEVVDV